jgi:hypothetical protein
VSLLAATQITAVATAVLALFAIVTAFYARRAYNEQKELTRQQGESLKVQAAQMPDQQTANAMQAGVLDLQARDLLRSLEQRRRAQAAQVFIWDESVAPSSPGKVVSARVTNSNGQPVHDLVVRWISESGLRGYPERAPHLMPGETREFTQTWVNKINWATATVWFRDADNHCWQTTSHGVLARAMQPARPRATRMVLLRTEPRWYSLLGLGTGSPACWVTDALRYPRRSPKPPRSSRRPLSGSVPALLTKTQYAAPAEPLPAPMLVA